MRHSLNIAILALTNMTASGAYADDIDYYAEAAPLTWESATKDFDIDKLSTWRDATPNLFACAVEKKTGVKHPAYGCDKLEDDKTQFNIPPDPCTPAPNYYSGPYSDEEAKSLPLSMVKAIHPDATDVKLAWEHENVQNISVELDRHYKDKVEAVSKLGINTEEPIGTLFQYCPKEYVCTINSDGNILFISMQNHTDSHDYIEIDLFEHMGSSDYECPNNQAHE